ncbi:MAG: hypothetical protein C0490_12505 [Marivirga sp.]|nr:hypothetical protein [Marivirga sp.]
MVCLFQVVITSHPTLGQDVFSPDAVKPSVEAKHIHEKVFIDGILNEDVWKNADSMGNFIQIEPDQGKPSQNRTIVKVLYNNEFLYIGAFCYDSLGKAAIRVPDMKRDFEWRSHDTFAICIDGFNDKRNSISFVTNPYGAQKDYLSFDALLFDGDWNGLWKVRTSITSEGWFAEFEIPWKTLRYPKQSKDDQIWGVNFLRLRRASNEISAWAPYPRSFGFNRMEYAGEIRQVEPPPPSTNIQVNPYSLFSLNKNDNNQKPSQYKYKIGGEIKWAINTNTVADLTANTDFAQADADVQVNNVSRFSILFPEKRQFFLENASFFGPGLVAEGNTGGNMQMLPFFSRRIGLSEGGRPMPIDAGIRLVNRSAKQSAGVMFVRQGSADSLPSSNSFVGRYSRNVGKQNRLGIIGTLKSSPGSYSNIVGGFDGFMRFGTSQSLSFMALQSSNTDNSGQGFGGYAQYYYTTNKITAWLTESVLTKDFNPELGFLSRTDVIGTSPGAVANLRGKYLPLKKYIRSYQPSIMASWYHQASTGILTEREIKVSPFWIEMQKGGYYGFTFSDVDQNLISDFNPLGVVIAAGNYHYRRLSFVAGSDPSAKISYTLQYDAGDYCNGELKTTDVSVSIIPLPHISIKVSLNRNQFEAVGKTSETKDISLYTIQGRLALNPRMQLIGLYQRITASRLDSYNVRFSWEYKPLSYVHIVLNSRESVGTDFYQHREAQGIFKVSYLKQF